MKDNGLRPLKKGDEVRCKLPDGRLLYGVISMFERTSRGLEFAIVEFEDGTPSKAIPQRAINKLLKKEGA